MELSLTLSVAVTRTYVPLLVPGFQNSVIVVVVVLLLSLFILIMN